jgi:hypothetical protein
MLDTEQRQQVVYVVGFEVEHTVCHGMKTLFVVGTPPVQEILESRGWTYEGKSFNTIDMGFTHYYNLKDESGESEIE